MGDELELRANLSPGMTSPGEQLRSARERAGLSREQVADSLRLLLSQVTALEEDRYEQLAGDTYVRGYLRAYAKLLDIPQSLVFDAFDRLQLERKPRPAPEAPVRQPKAGGVRRALLGLGLAVLAWVGVNLVVNVPALKPVAEPESVSLPQQPMPDSAWPESEAAWQPTEDDSPPVQTFAAEPAPEVTDAALEGAPVAEVVEEQVAVDQPEEQTLSDAAPQTLEPAAEVPASNRLRLQFSADCWVEVRDASGAQLLAKLQRDGDEVVLEGQPPYRIFFGNATAAQVQWNGADIPIADIAANNTARLIIGRP